VKGVSKDFPLILPASIFGKEDAKFECNLDVLEQLQFLIVFHVVQQEFLHQFGMQKKKEAVWTQIRDVATSFRVLLHHLLHEVM